MSRIKKTLIILALLAGVFLYPFQKAEPIRYIERSNGIEKIEKVPGEYYLNWLYNNPLGELSLEILVKKKLLSEWYGKRMDSPESSEKIIPFVEEYGVDLSIAQNPKYTTFNEFFYRKLKPSARPITIDSNILISPADGKVLAYKNISDQDFIVKGYRFNLDKYLSEKKLSEQFRNGSLIIIRLCPTDYHRFHFPLSGIVKNKMPLDGDYYSVSPIALRKKIAALCMNKRTHTILDNKQFGDVIISEVGATMVGSIIQTYTNIIVKKGQEKGYFKFGGSTVILIFQKGKLIIDDDLIENTKNGLETTIQMGAQIGIKKS